VTYSPAPCPLLDLLASLLEDVFLLSVNAKARYIAEVPHRLSLVNNPALLKEIIAGDFEHFF
jgi:hypothetical protein